MDSLHSDLRAPLKHVYGAVPQDLQVEALPGDASARRYYRLHVPGAPSNLPTRLVAMRLPEDPLQSDEKSGDRPKELPFINVQRLLADRGLPVPAIYAADMEGRILLLQDLGATTFYTHLQKLEPQQLETAYTDAVDLLARMHRACADGSPEQSLAYSRSFDGALLRWELDHFREWGLEALFGELPRAQRHTLDHAFDALVPELLAQPRGFVHRDYQSKNLMCHEGQLWIIDFQDALVGPRCYDLVALLCDSYIELDAPLQQRLMARYLAKAAIPVDPEAFQDQFWQVASQRKLKDAGRFVFIDRVRGNPDFLKWFPRTMRYVDRALSHVPTMSNVREILASRFDGYPGSVPVPAARTAKGR